MVDPVAQDASEAERIARLCPDDFRKWLKALKEPRLNDIDCDWKFWRRPAQAAPQGDWRLWLVLAGRGFGKTRMGAEWVRGLAEANGNLWIALVGATYAEVRTVMVEGESGLLAIAPDTLRPIYESSLRRLVWPNGAIASLYSAAEPESLRGPEHHMAWCDEVAKWERAEASWDNLMLTLRMGKRPRVMATTTPRPVPLIRRLLNEPGLALTRGATAANRAHLSPAWMGAIQNIYGGTRLGRQELEGEMIEDAEGALWSRDGIEACRTAVAPALRRVVIGVDPPVSSNGDACGIVVVGLGAEPDDKGRDIAYVLADCTVSGKSPDGWARAVAVAAAEWSADRIIAEGNQGGEMVESTLQGADVNMPVKRVHASIGKVARAEPVAALYESNRIKHVGAFPALEDEMCGLVVGGRYAGPGRSPDRADALVWACTELMLGRKGRVPRVRLL
jgi:phage terminase large subunit-like protein